MFGRVPQSRQPLTLAKAKYYGSEKDHSLAYGNHPQTRSDCVLTLGFLAISSCVI